MVEPGEGGRSPPAAEVEVALGRPRKQMGWPERRPGRVSLSLGRAQGTALTPCCVVGMATMGLGDMQALEQRAAEQELGPVTVVLSQSI